MTTIRRSVLAGLAAAALLASAPVLAQSAAAPRPGQPAPAFEAVDADGKLRRLSDFAGKTVILEWSNHDCPYVRKHYNSNTMQTLQRDMVKEGVVWLTIASSPPGEQGHVDAQAARDLTAKRNAAPSAVLLDPKGTVGRAYGALVTPHMYVIDGKGVVNYAGAIDDKPSASAASLDGAKSYIRQAVAEMKAGKAVSEPTSKAYGCVIKLAPAAS